MMDQNIDDIPLPVKIQLPGHVDIPQYSVTDEYIVLLETNLRVSEIHKPTNISCVALLQYVLRISK